MNRILISTAGALAVMAGAAQAQPLAEADATVLDTILVTTPLRRESSLERSTSTVTVIEEEEIRRSPAPDLPSLLSSFPGVNVSFRGGMGADNSVGLRGTSTSQTLILIDGINIRSATLGTTALYNIPLGAIERIEIAKGSHSAQYGADAVGGVINIVTRSGAAGCPAGKEICTTVTAGVLHPWGGHASADMRGTTQDGTRFALGGRLVGTQGYNFTAPTNPFGHDPDDEGFLLGALNLSLSRDFGWGEAYASGFYSRSRPEFDSWAPDPDQADNDVAAGKVGMRVDHSDDWSSKVEFTAAYDAQENFRKGVAGSAEFETLRYGAFASSTRTFHADDLTHVLMAGGEVYREEIASTSTYAVTGRTLAAVFAQHTLEFGALTVDSGIRYDHNELFGDATTYNLGASHEFVPGLTARASYATGFRAPTFNDLYWPPDPYSVGNPNLTPERSKGYELGLRWQPSTATSLDMAFYQTWVRDQINWAPVDPLDPFSPWMPTNFERVRIKGFEASLTHQFDDRWRGQVAIDLRDPRDETTGLVVLRQERVKVSAELGFQATEKLNLVAGVQHVASRYENAANTVVLPAYTLVDFGAVYAFDPMSELRLSIKNVFDEDYMTVNGYHSPGRTINFSYSRTF